MKKMEKLKNAQTEHKEWWGQYLQSVQDCPHREELLFAHEESFGVGYGKGFRDGLIAERERIRLSVYKYLSEIHHGTMGGVPIHEYYGDRIVGPKEVK